MASILRTGLVVVAVVAMLGGCGYRPLYGERGVVGSPSVREILAEVKITPIADRRGQMLHNALLDRLNQRGEPVAPRYTLTVRLRESVRALETRRDGTVTRADVVLTALYDLRDTANELVVFRERSESAVGFNLSTQRFAAVVSEDDARRRAVEQLADDIALQVALFVNRRHVPSAAASAAAAPAARR
jgi:LPS-assembly lipoprotein